MTTKPDKCKNSLFGKVKILMRANRIMQTRSDRKFGSDIFSQIFGLVIFGLIISGIIIFFSALVTDFFSFGIDFELLVFVLFIVLCLQIVWSTIACAKVYFTPAMNGLLTKYPISSRALFVSKFLSRFLRDIVIGLAILLPLLNVFGVLLGFGITFFVMAPIVSLVLTTLAFVIGSILSFAFVHIKAFLSNKFLLTLIVFVVFSALIFFGYMRALNHIVDVASAVDISVSEAVINLLVGINRFVYPATLLGNLLYANQFLMSLGILLAIIVGLFLLLHVLERAFYRRMLESGAGQDKVFYKRSTANNQRSQMRALLKREFLNVSRDPGLLFQYFAFIVITPLIVFLCVESSSGVLERTFGNIGNAGIVFLVVSVFCMIINSLAASSISREGVSFYLAKIHPVAYGKLIMSKAIFNLMCIMVCIIVTCVVLASFGFISFLEMIPIIFALILLSVFQICASINIDLKNPQFSDSFGIIKSEVNTSLAISVGLVICGLLGVLSISFAFWASSVIMLLIIVSVCALLAVGGYFWLFRNLAKKFSRV